MTIVVRTHNSLEVRLNAPHRVHAASMQQSANEVLEDFAASTTPARTKSIVLVKATVTHKGRVFSHEINVDQPRLLVRLAKSAAAEAIDAALAFQESNDARLDV